MLRTHTGAFDAGQYSAFGENSMQCESYDDSFTSENPAQQHFNLSYVRSWKTLKIKKRCHQKALICFSKRFN